MSLKHLIFDCDGVLVDSEPLSMQIDWEMLQEQGVRLTKEEVAARFIGFTFEAMIESIKAEFAIRLPTDFPQEKDRRLLALYESSLQPVEGIDKLLKNLVFPKSVGSNSPRSRVKAALRIAKLAAYFGDWITTFEDVKQAKPAPDIYLEAARRAGVSPGNCLVIEDSVAGVTAAVAAGCRVLGFTGTAPAPETHAETLRRAGAEVIFGAMSELPSLLSMAQ